MHIDDLLIAYQTPIRGFFFISLIALFGWLETRYVWRRWSKPRMKRWIKHISLSFISKIAIRLVFPVLLLQTAHINYQAKQGILNQHDLPFALKVILAVLALDLLIYFQHRLMHRFKWFWYCHRVHHIDKEIDVTTGVRFHPFEELFSMAFKMFGVVFLGAPVLAALIFEIVLNFGALFTHINIKLPSKVEKYLRWVFVTPGMHRVHHSDNPVEFNSNFGFCFIFWDKLFGSYRIHALTGEQRLNFGQEEYQDNKYQTMKYLLLLPFNSKNMKPRRKIRRKLWMDWTDN